jgi:hypothetical protein
VSVFDSKNCMHPPLDRPTTLLDSVTTSMHLSIYLSRLIDGSIDRMID